MIAKFITACAASWLFLSSPVFAQDDIVTELGTTDKFLDLLVGGQYPVPTNGVKTYSEGLEEIVELRLDKAADEFVLVGKAPGSTQILFSMRDGRRIRYNITVSTDRVKQRANIRLDFYFVQVSTTDNHQIGMAWPQGGVEDPLGNFGLNAFYDIGARASTVAASVTSNILPRLELLQTTGFAKIKRRATVITANGETGTFNTSTKLAFRIVSENAVGIQSVDFGSTIEAKPRFNKSTGRMDVQLNAEVSEQGFLGPDGIPNKISTSIQTLVNVAPGESILLAGLEAQNHTKSTEGLAGLSQIPVLGYLFGTKLTRKTKVENLVFIMPTVLESVDFRSEEHIQDAYKIWADFEGTWENDLYEIGKRRKAETIRQSRKKRSTKNR